MIDANDLAHILRQGLQPVAAQPCPGGGNGVINPQVTRFLLRDGQLHDLAHVKPVYYQAVDGSWRPLAEICAHHGNRRIVLAPHAWGRIHPRFLQWLMARQRLLGSALEFAGGVLSPERLQFAAPELYYPSPNPETTSVDGHVGRYGGGSEAWSTMHPAADGTSDWSDADGSGAALSVYGYNLVLISRVFALFDTSPLTAGAVISSASLSFYLTAKNDPGTTWSNVVQTTPASNTGLSTADYDQCGAVDNPTEGATRINFSAQSTGGYVDWTLNATGRGWISKTSITKMGLREGYDATNNSATGGDNHATYESAEHGGSSQDPKLGITYTLSHGQPQMLPSFMPLLGR